MAAFRYTGDVEALEEYLGRHFRESLPVMYFFIIESATCSYVYDTDHAARSVDRYLDENPAPCDILI